MDVTVEEKPVKRFIAGAVCPKCAQMDRIVMYKKDGGDFRECVECGFNDELHIQPQVRELETRVNISKETIEAETQVLQFKPIAKNKDD
ncbi:YheV family putative zinc ribbon protein [Sessilibacter sp. MAH4]